MIGLSKKISELGLLLQNLQKAKSVFEKLEILDNHPSVRNFIQKPSLLKTFAAGLSPECEYVLKAVIAIGQRAAVLPFQEIKKANFASKMRSLLNQLMEIEDFYKEIGGVIGYHDQLLHYLHKGEMESKEEARFYPPSFIPISDCDANVRKAVLWGIEHLPGMCELYPLGGAADRLHLQDPATKEELPAARLLFAGRTLLETLIADLEAREYLYFKIYGKEVLTPIAMMTSHEKNNNDHVLAICEKNQWFGRPKDSFKLFIQPLVPTITDSGKWCMREGLKPLLKPGGHGVIWKLARDSGVLDWFKQMGRTKTLVRQINNPIAGLDYALLAFTGWGCRHDMFFGFASCPRELKAAEGVNILIERKVPEGYSYALSNIEYCDFAKYGIEDVPEEKEGKYSKFSSNTNILFADLRAIESAVGRRPFPGILINLKNVKFFSGKKQKEEKVARLESTMQNIADEFLECYPEPLPEQKRDLSKTFITYNARHKTISTAKKVYFEGGSTLETPERCFYDLMVNAYDLLRHCDFKAPPLPSLEKYLQEGPTFLFRYHPALGPLYSIIAQKMKSGELFERSELVCEIAELSLEQIFLRGSLLIIADNITGHQDEKGLKHPSHLGGKCLLKKVKIMNKGIDFEKTKFFWKDEIIRKEAVTILLHGNAEFSAENITISGGHMFEVENGCKLTLTEKDGRLIEVRSKLQEPSWFWRYQADEDFNIRLSKSRS